jgi:hypothetical protein
MSEVSEEMLERFAAIIEALAGEGNVSVGQKGKKGFGSSALQVNGRIFAMISSAGSFVAKLPKQRVEELEVSGVGAKFDPGHGRLMKEWFAVNRSSINECLPLAREALRFVAIKS